MRKLLLCLLILFSLPATSFATSTDDVDPETKKPFWAINGMVSLALNTGMGEYPFTPAISFRTNRQEFFFGVDVYSTQRSIYGLQIGYKYYLFPVSSRINFYGQANIEFVNYSSGFSKNQRFNYPTKDTSDFRGVIKDNLFLCSVGGGLDFKLSKQLYAYMLVGYGINITNRTYIRDISRLDNKPPEGKQTLQHLYLQAGFRIRISKKR